MKNYKVNNSNIKKNKKKIYCFKLKYMQKLLLLIIRMNEKESRVKKSCIIDEYKI